MGKRNTSNLSKIERSSRAIWQKRDECGSIDGRISPVKRTNRKGKALKIQYKKLYWKI